MKKLTLFLDFDGVLHGDDVDSINGLPILNDEGELFMWASLLDDALSIYSDDIQIVLSTSWAIQYGLEKAASYLPEKLQAMVVDVVWVKKSYLLTGITNKRFRQMSRFEQIAQYIRRKHIQEWIAIDNDDERWPYSQRDRLVLTEDGKGLTTPGALDELHFKILRILRQKP